MSAPSVTIRSLPASWFERPQYAPTIDVAGRSVWFPLREDFTPVRGEAALGSLRAHNRTGAADTARALRETRERWELPLREAAGRSLRAVETAGAVMVVAGQQPGFLGGPLYTLYKAVSAVAVARRHAAASGRPCVPVFWVASEDHDLEEVRRARFPATGSEEVEFALPHVEDRRPVADYPIDAASREVLDEAKRFLALRRHGPLAAELIDGYSGGTIASGFARILTELFDRDGLLVIDPATLRSHAAPLVRVVLETADDVIAAIAAGREEVAERGLKPFVAERFPLFILEDGRRHYLEPVADGFRWADRRPVPAADLVALLEESPDRFSPGALLRPLVQQAVLPAVLTVGGPAEIGYHAQLGPLARHLGVEVPRVALRLHATLVDGRDARTVETIPLERLAAARNADGLLEPGEEADALAELDLRAGAVEATLGAALATLPPGKLRDRLARRSARVRQDIAHLGEQIASERRALRVEEGERAAAIWRSLFPGEGLQERHWSFLHYVAKHGREWIAELIEAAAAEPLSLAHRLVLFGRST